MTSDQKKFYGFTGYQSCFTAKEAGYQPPSYSSFPERTSAATRMGSHVGANGGEYE
jgi:hypothetical protein